MAVLAVIALPGKSGSLAVVLVLVLTPLIHDRATKRVLRRRYGVRLRRFIGFQVLGVLVTVLVVLTVLFLLSAIAAGSLVILFVGQLGHPEWFTPESFKRPVIAGALGLGFAAVQVLAYGYAAHAALRRRIGFEIVGVALYLSGIAEIWRARLG